MKAAVILLFVIGLGINAWTANAVFICGPATCQNNSTCVNYTNPMTLERDDYCNCSLEFTGRQCSFATCRCPVGLEETILSESRLAGVQLTPGCYRTPESAPLILDGSVTLNGTGRYHFMSYTNITAFGDANVTLAGGASCNNVSWCTNGDIRFHSGASVYGEISTVGVIPPLAAGNHLAIIIEAGAILIGSIGAFAGNLLLISHPAGAFIPCPFNECLSNPCQNGATCVDQPNGFTCSCPALFVGNLCQEVGCRDCPCGCPPGSIVTPTSGGIGGGAPLGPGCYRPNPPGKDLTVFAGTKFSGTGRYTFLVPGNLVFHPFATIALRDGASCENVTFCVVDTVTMLQSAQTLGTINSTGDIVMGESSIHYGDLTSVAGAVALQTGATVVPCFADRCRPDPCQNDGVCTNAITDTVCTCPGYFTGDTCEATRTLENRNITDAKTTTVRGDLGTDTIVVANIGDINGDGMEDVFVWSRDASASRAFFGSYTRRTSIDLTISDPATGFRVVPPLPHDPPPSVSGADVNADGLSDMIIWDCANTVYVVFGRLTGFGTVVNLTALTSTTGVRIIGPGIGLGFGERIRANGDVNGDDIADIVVSAYQQPTLDDASFGVVYAIFGNPDLADMSVTSLDGTNGFALAESHGNFFFGETLAVCDLNGDGYSDIAAGYYDQGNPMDLIRVLYGRSSWTATVDALETSGAIGFIIRPAHGIIATSPMVNAGDINGDGIEDLAFVSRHGLSVIDTENTITLISVLLGSGDGFDNETGPSVEFVSEHSYPEYMSGIGDWDGDGYGDIAIAVTSTKISPYEFLEGVFIVNGRADFDTSIYLSIECDLYHAGQSSTLRPVMAANFDGIGNAELFVGVETGGGDTAIQILYNQDTCGVSPCLHGGTCTAHPTSFTCQCTPDRQGDTCQELAPVESSSSSTGHGNETHTPSSATSMLTTMYTAGIISSLVLLL